MTTQWSEAKHATAGLRRPPYNTNKAIRDGRPRPPRHQVGWDIVRRECACQISWWSVEKWRRYYILKFHGNTFRWPTTLTFDLKFWKYLSVTEYPYSMCMLSFMMIGWEMTEILHFEFLRKHGQTHKHTNRHGHYNTSPSPYGGRGNNSNVHTKWTKTSLFPFYLWYDMGDTKNTPDWMVMMLNEMMVF